MLIIVLTPFTSYSQHAYTTSQTLFLSSLMVELRFLYTVTVYNIASVCFTYVVMLCFGVKRLFPGVFNYSQSPSQMVVQSYKGLLVFLPVIKSKQFWVSQVNFEKRKKKPSSYLHLNGSFSITNHDLVSRPPLCPPYCYQSEVATQLIISFLCSKFLKRLQGMI